MTTPTVADTARVRLTIVAVVVVCLFGSLFARLWYLQVINEPQAQAAAQDNFVRLVYTPAPRGRILDRNGKVLVDNRVSEVVTISRDAAAREPSVMRRLAVVLGTTYANLQSKVTDQRYSPYVPVPLAEDVPKPTIIYIDEHQAEFPGVAASAVAERFYPYGTLAANVLGYVGQINSQELTTARKKAGYQAGEEIGKTGVEAAYESVLRGRPGVSKLQVDSRGRVLGVLGSEPPVQGHDLWLSIDISVQQLAERSLAAGLAAARKQSDKVAGGPGKPFAAPAGAAVVMDPQDGTVLALATDPTYNPQDFVGGISQAKYNRYLIDPNHPLDDRTIQGDYAPGSTFKLVTATAGLQAGLIDPNASFDDKGFFQVGPTKFFNDNHQVYGPVNLSRALTVSSDSYFYNVGAEFWNARSRFGDDGLQNVARQYGFGSPTGIALPNEASGRIPDKASRAKEHAQLPSVFTNGGWYTGDNVNTAIGQGEVDVTPLQMANAYSAFANGGTLWTPRIAIKVTDQTGKVLQLIPAVVKNHVYLPPRYRDPILTGLEGVVANQGGTAQAAFSGFPLSQYQIAGKTGTAQVTGKDPTSVFVSFAPAGNPQYVVDTFLEQSGYGADAAAPVVRQIYDGLFRLTPEPIVLPTTGVD